MERDNNAILQLKYIFFMLIAHDRYTREKTDWIRMERQLLDLGLLFQKEPLS